MTVTAVTVGATVAAGPVGADGARTPSAHATRAVSLNETGRLHLVSKHGFTLNELGTASGTIRGKITVHLKIVSSSRVTAEVTITPQGGSLSGSGNATYHKGETEATFSGGLSINRRSGTYSRAQGSGLRFSGTIAQSNDAITVHVSGRLSY
ncbi:MAG TPA: hypothetical protein VF294_14765 [Polyangiaceae bacterium]